MEKMKKTYSFLFAAVALFAAASCQDELISNETPAVQGERFTVTAAADAQTKTALTDEGLNSVWTPGDAIAVIDFIGNGAEFTTDITENAASAKFTCENFNTGGLTDISALPIVALYPYQDGLTCSIQSQLNQTGDNTIKGITFPHEQTAVAGSFDKSAAFTWAMATGAKKDNLVFNNLYSLLKVKVTEENITSITVSATSGSLAGKVTLPITQSGAELTVVDGQGQSSVTLTCKDGFDTEKYYYICVLPGTYEGFSIALNGTVVKTKPTAAVFKAAIVYPLGEIAMPEPVKQDRNLQFSSTSVTVELGDNTFSAPTLTGVLEGVITYESSNTNAATVDESGEITLVGKGTTIITATANETTDYYAAQVSYTLTVKDDEKEIYLYAGVWDDDPAVEEFFEAWYWGDGVTAAWAKFTHLEGEYYKAVVPSGVTGMKFLRKGPGTHASESWSSWNDSGDQTVPFGKNCFKVSSWDSYVWITYTE